MNQNGIIKPVNDLPIHGMKMRVSVQNGLLTLEFERNIDTVQFNKRDATAFVQGLVAHIKGME